MRLSMGHNSLMLASLAAAALFQMTPTAMAADNTLTNAEKKAGWTLLFDGKTTKGWHNFLGTGVKPGWVIKDGILKCEDPHNAGDIVTDKKYSWFELSIEFNYEKDQNSGVMFHVNDVSDAAWHSGPEVQIYDHKFEPGVQTTGFLYELYAGQKDAAKPAGEWNHFRIIVSKAKCETYVNGVKYYEYVLGSPEFKAKVAASKFADMPDFAKVPNGRIGLQGDHGKVAFKNIKIKVLK